MKALIFRRDLIKFAFLSLQIEIEIASWKVSIHFIKIKCQEQYIFFIKEKKTRCRPPPFAYLLHVYLFYKSRSFVIVKKPTKRTRDIQILQLGAHLQVCLKNSNLYQTYFDLYWFDTEKFDDYSNIPTNIMFTTLRVLSPFIAVIASWHRTFDVGKIIFAWYTHL